MLELLPVVWCIEYSYYYVYGTNIEAMSDQKTLASLLKKNHGKKNFSCQLLGWLDKSLSFQINIVHDPQIGSGTMYYQVTHLIWMEKELS